MRTPVSCNMAKVNTFTGFFYKTAIYMMVVSCVGEYIEPEFTEEELAFMENHLAKELNIESFDVLDMNYVRSLEQELANARNAIAQLQFTNATLYNNNIMLGQRSMMTNQSLKNEDLNDGGPLTMEDLSGHEVACA